MASTYSTNLKIELIGTGEQAGVWGATTNTNLGTALEQAVVGRATANFTSDANLTLTLTESNAAQVARAFVLNVTSGVSLTVTRELIVPTVNKPYLVQNNTTGGQSVLVKTVAGTGVTVPNGREAFVYADGTNVVSAIDFLPSLALGTDLAVVDGGTGASDAATARTNLGLAIGTNVQAYDAGLQSIAGLTTAADRMIYTTASDTYAVATLTAAGRNLLDDADTAAQRTTLGATTVGSNIFTASNPSAIRFLRVNADNTASLLSDADFRTAIGAGTGTGDVTLTGTQTLTNKTLTNPTINGFTGNTSVVNIGSGQFYKDASGNVGIGTNSPQRKLQVSLNAAPGAAQSAKTGLLIQNLDSSGTAGSPSTAVIQFAYDAGAPRAYIEAGTFGNDILAFGFAGTERMRIDSAGNVGIGKTNPQASLDYRETINVISTGTTAVASRTYILTASLTLTLPASPTAGDWVAVVNRSATATPVVARNAQNIMGLAENLTLDSVNATIRLVFADATRGWVLN